MRQLLFVTCFTLGVSLMVLSGYVPQSVRAQSAPDNGAAVRGRVRSDAAPAMRSPSRAWMYHPDSGGMEGTAPDLAPLTESPAAGPGASDTQDTAALQAASQPADSGTSLADIVAPPAAPDATDQAGAERDPADRARRHGRDAAGADASTASADGSGKTAETPADAPPVADAGQDRAVWSGAGGVLLDGSKSSGEGLTYTWRQTAGPTQLAIEDPSQVVTWAAGLTADHASGQAATYEFELAVSDSAGRQATHSVRVTAQAAPELEIDPPAEPRFEERDGYTYGVFESWATSHQTDRFTFTITSPQRLKVTTLGGDPHELTGRKTGSGCVYHVTLYLVPEQATSFTELLVETNDKVPGIVRLGVSWYAAAVESAAD